jgi:uncharacterized glyoxalase superfamily protein PhnB
MTGRPEKLFPTLRYQDPAAAITWLCDVLGFERHYVAEYEGRIVHAQLRRGEDLLYLGPDDPNDKYGLHSPRVLNGGNQCVCVAINEDIDAHCERARAGGAEIVTAPYDTPYGAREYSCRDLEGHIWSFSNYWGEPGSGAP